MADEGRHAELFEKILSLPAIVLSDRQICDLELLLNGAFSPLVGFMSRKLYDGVVESMRLPDGAVWPMPITLDLPAERAQAFAPGDEVALCSKQMMALAILAVTDVWQPDKQREAVNVFGTTDTAHPGVNDLVNRSGEFYLGGSLTGIRLPEYYDFRHLRQSPA